MKLKYILLILIILILGAAGAYWYYFMQGGVQVDDITGEPTGSGGFVPFDRTGTTGGSSTGTSTSTTPQNTGSNIPVQSPATASKPLPKLRLLSTTPVGGYGASTTASTSVVRWVDRGRGNIYEARSTSLDLLTISNTVFPRIYESLWNRDLTSFIAQYLESDNESIRTVSSNILKRTSVGTTSLSVNLTSYELRGNTWSAMPLALALSPKKDRVFYFTADNGKGAGYTSSLDGKNITKIFETPLTQITAEWPEENTIVITTKAAATAGGYVYFVNPKTGAWKKIVGPLPGLTAKVSRDARYIFLSVTGNAQNMLTSIYDVKTGKGTDALVRTIADKCVWGNFYKDLIYCAAPSQVPAGIYPDEWFMGIVSFADKIWQIKAPTGELKLVSSIVDQSDRLIDAFHLDLDPKDNYLYFMNKNDLSLWSLDLVAQ